LKEIVEKIMKEDTSVVADIKLSIMEKLDVEYKLKVIDEAKEDYDKIKEFENKRLKDRSLLKSKDIIKLSNLGIDKEIDGEDYTKHEIIFKDKRSIIVYL